MANANPFDAAPLDPTPDSNADPNPEAPVKTGCAFCESQDIEQEYKAPICGRCRESLVLRPFPGWIKFATLAVVLLLGFAVVRAPAAIMIGVEYEKGRRLEQQGQFQPAADNYDRVLKKYPASEKVLVRIAVTRFHAGQILESALALDQLKGKKVSKDVINELDHIIRGIEAHIEKLNKE